MTEETMKKANNHGGARESAGRKKAYPKAPNHPTLSSLNTKKPQLKTTLFLCVEKLLASQKSP